LERESGRITPFPNRVVTRLHVGEGVRGRGTKRGGLFLGRKLNSRKKTIEKRLQKGGKGEKKLKVQEGKSPLPEDSPKNEWEPN